MKQQASLPLLITNGRIFSHTPLGRSVSINSSSTAVHGTYISSSCSNFVSPSHLPLKKIKPEPWQRLFEGKKEQEISIKKNTSNFDAMINEDFINLLNQHSLFDENSQTSFLPAPIQSHIDHLYEQIDDLTLQLSEERSKHKQIRMKNGEVLLKQLKGQEKEFQELLQNKLLDHQNELKKQENKYLELLNKEKTQNLEREEGLRNEIEFLKKSFHTYKITLDKENTEQLQIKINEALVAMKEEVSDRTEEINKKLNDVVMRERKHMSERQKIEIENIRKQHKKEIETIRKTFADLTIDQERFESMNKELVFTKIELDQTRERAINLSNRVKDLESQHTKTTRELNDYHIQFNEKIKEIEKLYAERTDQF